jgi:replication factor C subunit 2/4
MAGFFDMKARKEAAALNGGTSKAPPPKETTRLQPWVEK